jgi:hypothetical protein
VFVWLTSRAHCHQVCDLISHLWPPEVLTSGFFGLIDTRIPPPAPAPQPAAKVGFPATCTPDQLGTVLKQLPSEGCLAAPYLQSCSMTMATKMPCRLKDWMRGSYATQRMDLGFISVFIGCKTGDASIMDSLAIGSSTPNTFSTTEWVFKSEVTDACSFKDMTFSGNPNLARVVCVQKDEATATPLTANKTKLDLKDKNFQVTIADVGLGLDTREEIHNTPPFKF